MTAPTPAPLILAVDTSSSLGSVALSREGTLVNVRTFEADRGHSRKLLPAIESVFSETGVSPRDVSLFAVVVGPGSFTGLRVSLASVRGMAGARPCFGALATDVAAWAGRGPSSKILAMTDLFHGEVFASVHDGEGRLISNREAGELSVVLESLKTVLTGPVLAVGSAAIKHRSQIGTALPEITFLDLSGGLAPHLASLALDQASPATTSPAGDLLPFYLRDPLTRGLLGPPREP